MTVEEYAAYFHGIDLPKEIQLDKGVKIIDVPKFINTQLSILQSSTSEYYKMVVSARLDKLISILEQTPAS
jgi:hypothetical protein